MYFYYWWWDSYQLTCNKRQLQCLLIKDLTEHCNTFWNNKRFEANWYYLDNTITSIYYQIWRIMQQSSKRTWQGITHLREGAEAFQWYFSHFLDLLSPIYLVGLLFFVSSASLWQISNRVSRMSKFCNGAADSHTAVHSVFEVNLRPSPTYSKINYSSWRKFYA